MANKLDQEARMTIQALTRRGQSNRAVARMLGVHENAVRYHLQRQVDGTTDGRARQRHLAADFDAAITVWLDRLDGGGPLNLAVLHDWLVTEHAYPGSLRSLQRYFRVHYPQPRVRARRRVETPAGAQAQADWGTFPRVMLAGSACTLYAFGLKLSFSRFPAFVWSRRTDQLAWHHVHNAALRRFGGVPAVIRIDNLKTGVSRGAGPWGTINRHYRRYADSVGFHIDACLPREPQAKGKIEREIRGLRASCSPYQRHWDSLAELQAATDAGVARLVERRICPATGHSVADSLRQEQRVLAPLPVLPEPFDLAVTRTVAHDATVGFEQRRYSVPFAWIGRPVEVRGAAGRVQVLADHRVIAVHPRHTPERILIDPAHYDGPSTDRVAAPPPLGRMGRKLAAIAALRPEHRPLDLYAALAEVAR
jgi:transposase